MRDLFGEFVVCTDVRMIPNPAVVLFRYDESMAGRIWVDTQEGNEIVVFIYDFSGDFLFDNFAENAVFHRGILTQTFLTYIS